MRILPIVVEHCLRMARHRIADGSPGLKLCKALSGFEIEATLMLRERENEFGPSAPRVARDRSIVCELLVDLSPTGGHREQRYCERMFRFIVEIR